MNWFFAKFARPRGRIGLYTRAAFIAFNLLMLFLIYKVLENISTFSNTHKMTKVNVAFIQGKQDSIDILLLGWLLGAAILFILVIVTGKRIQPQASENETQQQKQTNSQSETYLS
jgi:hypothetical protein